MCGAIRIAEVVAVASSWELVHDGEGDADASMPKGQHTLQRFFRFLFKENFQSSKKADTLEVCRLTDSEPILPPCGGIRGGLMTQNIIIYLHHVGGIHLSVAVHILRFAGSDWEVVSIFAPLFL